MNYRDIEEANLAELGNPLHIRGKRNQGGVSVSSLGSWMHGEETR